jgi:hypothetical protein
VQAICVSGAGENNVHEELVLQLVFGVLGVSAATLATSALAGYFRTLDSARRRLFAAPAHPHIDQNPYCDYRCAQWSAREL